MSLSRVLVVDDFPGWRNFVRERLQKHPGIVNIGEAEDGTEAVQKAKELRPDVILLDLNLPTLNGIAATRLIRDQSPDSKILLVSTTRNRDIAIEALRSGADGYVVKSEAATDLLPAIKAVLQGKQFVSAVLQITDIVEREPSVKLA